MVTCTGVPSHSTTYSPLTHVYCPFDSFDVVKRPFVTVLPLLNRNTNATYRLQSSQRETLHYRVFRQPYLTTQRLERLHSPRFENNHDHVEQALELVLLAQKLDIWKFTSRLALLAFATTE